MSTSNANTKTAGTDAAPAPTTAPPPFNRPSADIVLRAADHVDFRVRRAILEEASTVFADMFSMPQPPTRTPSPEPESQPIPPVIPVTEASEVLEPVLRMCYPVSGPAFASLGELGPVLEAVRKYQMDELIPGLARRLEELSTSAPLQAYALALKFGMQDTARVAAKHFLNLTHPWPFAEELDDISGGAYFRLLAYREKCVQAARAVALSMKWMETDDFTWLTCIECTDLRCNGSVVVYLVLGQKRDVPTWFHNHLIHMSTLLTSRPSRCVLEDPCTYDQITREAARCTACRNSIAVDIRRFHTLVANEVERRISEVVLEIRESR